jgi:TIR domain
MRADAKPPSRGLWITWHRSSSTIDKPLDFLASRLPLCPLWKTYGQREGCGLRGADYFVSYASADRAWAEWIAWQLEAEGYTVVVQAWDFAPGRDRAHEMQYATAPAERVVAVLSPSYLASLHGEAEWRAFYAKDPSGERGLLLPVRVSDVEPPRLLKTRIYVDLVGRDPSSARATLLAAARRIRGKPTREPEFPEAPGHSMGHGTEAPQFPGEPENQRPTIATWGPRGGQNIAPSSRPRRSALPPELLEAITSEAAGRRTEAVAELGRLLHAHPSEVAAQSRALLQQLIDDDSRSVSQAAIRALSTRPSASMTPAFTRCLLPRHTAETFLRAACEAIHLTGRGTSVRGSPRETTPLLRHRKEALA